MKTKVELLEEIVEKQDDIIQVYYNQSEIYTDMGHEIVAGLLDELASLKSQLAEAGEENEEKQEEEQTCHNCKFAGTLGEPCDICMIDGNDMWQPC